MKKSLARIQGTRHLARYTGGSLYRDLTVVVKQYQSFLFFFSVYSFYASLIFRRQLSAYCYLPCSVCQVVYTQTFGQQ